MAVFLGIQIQETPYFPLIISYFFRLESRGPCLSCKVMDVNLGLPQD